MQIALIEDESLLAPKSGGALEDLLQFATDAQQALQSFLEMTCLIDVECRVEPLQQLLSLALCHGPATGEATQQRHPWA